MKLYNNNYYLSVIVTFICVISCTKNITVSISNTTPQYVIQGRVTDSLPPYIISITQTNNVYSQQPNPPISGAFVTIYDKNNNILDTLTETIPNTGNYSTSAKFIRGTTGNTYNLTVKIGNSTFTSTSTMPYRTPFDSIQLFPAFRNNNNYFVIPIYTNPTNPIMFYYFELYVNNQKARRFYTDNSITSLGLKRTLPLLNPGIDISSGQTVTVYMFSIDNPIYNYFSGLDQALSNSSVPSNPTSNITGNALGFFSAATFQAKTIIAK